ncbi:RAMA domain-containing protein [Pycnococcus provasolii]
MLRVDSSQKEPWRRDAAKFAIENASDVETAQGCKAAETGDRVPMAAECASGEARNHIHNPEPNPYPTGSTKQAAYEVLFRATPEERQAGLPLEEFVRRIRTMLKVDEDMWPANTKTPDGTLHAAMAGDSCFLKTIKRTFTLSGSAPSKIAGYGNRAQQLPMEQTYEDDEYATMMSRRDTAKSKDEKTLLTYEELIEREFEQKRKIAEANRSNVAAKKQKTSHVVVEDEVLDCSVDSLERPDEIPPNPFLAIKKPDAYAFPLPPPPLSSPSPSLPPPPPLPSSSFPPPPPLPPTTPPDRIQNSLQSVQIATRMKAIAYEVLANATSGERETGLTITEIMQRSIHVSESLGEDVEFAFSTTVTLAMLIAAGALTPGVDKLSCKCFDNTHNAELLQDGRIRYLEMTFDSPSAFSVYCKRIYNPTRRADDGWGSVTYDGVTLKDIKTKAMESMKDKDALSKEKLLESLNSDNCFAKKASGRFTLSYSVREERDTLPWSGPIPQSSRSKRLPISKERCSGFADFVAFITSAADDVRDSTENDCSKELPRGVHRRAGRSKMFFQFSLKGKPYNAYPASTDAVSGDATALAYIRDHAIRHFGSTSVLNYPQVEQLPEQYTAAGAELLEQLRCKIGTQSKQVNNAEAASTAPNQAQCTASGARVVERSPHDPPASWWKTRSKDKGVATSFLGWRVVKRFNGKSYHGTIDGFDEDEAWYHVTFDDNDQEEVDLNEILSISKRRYFLSKQIPVLCQLDDDNILTEKVLGCTFSHRAAALFKRRRKWSLRQREISAVRITSQVPHAQDLRNVRDAVMAYLVSLGVDVGVSLAYGVPINFPREAPSHRSVEQYTVDSSDARVSLRGEFGCRATDIIPANTVIGVYTGHCFFNDEMFAMIERMIAPTDGVSRLKAERDVESGIQEFTRFNRQSKRFDGPAAGKGELLMVSSFGDAQGVCGRINDALVDVYDSNELVDDGYNVMCVEAELQGWPFLFVCTTRDVRAGSDLRMDYTGYYWERIGEMKRRLDFVQL